MCVHSVIIAHRRDIIYRTSWGPRRRRQRRIPNRSDLPGTYIMTHTRTHAQNHMHTRRLFSQSY